MNQNFQDTEKALKVAVFAGGQAAISLGTSTLLMKTLCTTYLKCLYIYSNKNTYKLYSVFMQHYQENIRTYKGEYNKDNMDILDQ